MRVVICWAYISGYMASCWRALAATEGIDLHVIAAKFDDPKNAAFADDICAGFNSRLLNSKEYVDVELVSRLVRDLSPDIVVICGWVCAPYVRLALDRAFASVRFVMGMDTPLKHTLRQRLARLKIGALIDRMDRVAVAGERAWQYGRFLRVSERKLMRGMYGIDYDSFAPILAKRLALPGGWPKRFLFCGRYIDIKGVDLLCKAYERYCALVSNPWPLAFCGSGEMAPIIRKTPGAIDLGFIQPRDLPDVWLNTGVLVLPSRYDPWPLVVVEAAAAGLPVICTEACGSAVEVIRDGYNGKVATTDNIDSIVRKLRWMQDHYDDLPEMGRRGQQFAAPYSAQVWATRWAAMCHELMTEPVSA